MEFEYKASEILSNDFVTVNNEDVIASYKLSNEERRRTYLQLEKVIDALGELSAIEQELKSPITTFKNLINTNHRVYMAIDAEYNNGKGAATGFIKVGEKKLFLTDGSTEQVAVNVTCVLDFYVYNTQQRKGWGKRIFDNMLEVENITPADMAFDRPSPKLSGFLAKHYNLINTIWQPNRYTIYKDYFEKYSNPAPITKQANGSSSIRKIISGGFNNSGTEFQSTRSSQRRGDSISKIIHQVPPSP